ncbi:MAG: hypothetical protein RI894_449, partial [Bacteroidota bacterium]
MTAVTTPAALRRRAIPDNLVYEVLDGQKIYYRNYKQILNRKITLESVMGYGALQWVLINLLTKHFNLNLPAHLMVLSGEGGLHLSHSDNLSLDFTIFETTQLDFANLKNKYIDFPPKCVIEVDTKAQIEVANNVNYYTRKTKKLLEFGVPEVVWIFTETKTIWLAKPNTAWLIVNWDDEITVMNQSFSLQ